MALSRPVLWTGRSWSVRQLQNAFRWQAFAPDHAQGPIGTRVSEGAHSRQEQPELIRKITLLCLPTFQRLKRRVQQTGRLNAHFYAITIGKPSSRSIGSPGGLNAWGIMCILSRWQYPQREKFSRQPLQRVGRLRDFIANTLNVYFSPGASTTAASVVSSRKVKVSRKYSSTTVLEWLW